MKTTQAACSTHFILNSILAKKSLYLVCGVVNCILINSSWSRNFFLFLSSVKIYSSEIPSNSNFFRQSLNLQYVKDHNLSDFLFSILNKVEASTKAKGSVGHDLIIIAQ